MLVQILPLISSCLWTSSVLLPVSCMHSDSAVTDSTAVQHCILYSKVQNCAYTQVQVPENSHHNQNRANPSAVLYCQPYYVSSLGL